MVTCLPKFIDPFALAEKNASLEGIISVKEFGRLSELLFRQDGEIAVKLHFSKDGGFSGLRGHISASLKLKCQRCLESFEYPVDAELNLGIVNSLERADKLPESVDPLILLDQDKVLLNDIIEDELLLNLPIIPKHEYDCSPLTGKGQQQEIKNKTNSVAESPFSRLAELMKLEIYHGSTKK